MITDATFIPEYRDEQGAVAMARDHALLEAAHAGAAPPDLVRCHGWAAPTLSLGRAQPFPSGLAEEAAEAHVDLVRRPTGGGWLLHLPGDLSLTLVRGGPLGPGELRLTTRCAARLLAEALASLGLPALVYLGAFAPVSRAEVCFQRTDRDEVTVDGVKVAGVALAKIGRSALVQSAVPLVETPRALAGFAARWDPVRAAAAGALEGVNEQALRGRIEDLVAAAPRWSPAEPALAARERAFLAERYAYEAFTRRGAPAGPA